MRQRTFGAPELVLEPANLPLLLGAGVFGALQRVFSRVKVFGRREGVDRRLLFGEPARRRVEIFGFGGTSLNLELAPELRDQFLRPTFGFSRVCESGGCLRKSGFRCGQFGARCADFTRGLASMRPWS
jgi:hypothetical protein